MRIVDKCLSSEGSEKGWRVERKNPFERDRGGGHRRGRVRKGGEKSDKVFKGKSSRMEVQKEIFNLNKVSGSADRCTLVSVRRIETSLNQH